MGRYTDPNCRLCRRERTQLFLKGERCINGKCPVVRKKGPPGKLPKRRPRISDYGHQLREKQKMKRFYGVLEAQFRRFFKTARRKRGITGDNLVQMLESRLDNVVYRMGFAASRKMGRQLVGHGHFRVNDRRVTIPSYLVSGGDTIKVEETSKKMTCFRESLKIRFPTVQDKTKWVEVDQDNLEGSVITLPERSDIEDMPANEQLVVELFSK